MSGGRLAGKVALITGGARGQGAEEGRLFAAQGATVILSDVLDTEGEATAGAIEGATYRHLDVSSETEWEQLVDAIVAWGDEQAVVDRVAAHHERGADHVALQVLPLDGMSVPLDHWRRLSEAVL